MPSGPSGPCWTPFLVTSCFRSNVKYLGRQHSGRHRFQKTLRSFASKHRARFCLHTIHIAYTPTFPCGYGIRRSLYIKVQVCRALVSRSIILCSTTSHRCPTGKTSSSMLALPLWHLVRRTVFFAAKASDALSAGTQLSCVGAPHPTSTAPSESATVVPASDNPNYPIFPPGSDVSAQPIRDGLGATILGPQNLPLQQQNPDLIAPPTTDHGSVFVLPLLLV